MIDSYKSLLDIVRSDLQNLRMKDFHSKNEKISNDGNGRCYLNP